MSKQEHKNHLLRNLEALTKKVELLGSSSVILADINLTKNFTQICASLVEISSVDVYPFRRFSCRVFVISDEQLRRQIVRLFHQLGANPQPLIPEISVKGQIEAYYQAVDCRPFPAREPKDPRTHEEVWDAVDKVIPEVQTHFKPTMTELQKLQSRPTDNLPKLLDK